MLRGSAVRRAATGDTGWTAVVTCVARCVCLCVPASAQETAAILSALTALARLETASQFSPSKRLQWYLRRIRRSLCREIRLLKCSDVRPLIGTRIDPFSALVTGCF